MMSRLGTMKSGVHLFMLPIGPQLLQWESEAFLFKLPHEDRLRILRYKHWQDRQRALLGTVLVRWMIREFADIQHAIIARNAMGRPYLANQDSWQGDFNLSHSGEWIVAALTHQGHIGVDVEKIECLNEDVMAYAMSEGEINRINQYSKIDRSKLFYELWTMKEAIYKTGLFPNATPKSLDTVELKSKRKDIFTQSLYVDQQHPITICWDREQSSVKQTILNRNELV
ncbi:4'-phosphopantetheinyl transferase superfamily protein [Lysinibacillus fusiformis]|nr:4'-phosphopantetheinyl transferase superfamily protein [Lysinibacillus fusiformis]